MGVVAHNHKWNIWIRSWKPAFATQQVWSQPGLQGGTVKTHTHTSRLSNMDPNKEGNWAQCSGAGILEVDPGGTWIWGELELWGALEFKKRGGVRTGERGRDKEREFYARLAKWEKEFTARSKEQSRRGDAPKTLLTSANTWGENSRAL